MTEEKKNDKDKVPDIKKILFETRNVFLNGEIDEELSKKIMEELLAMDLKEKNWITLYINSPGGDFTSGLAIIDTIEGLRSPLRTVIIGEACSLATVVALFGKKRYITKNSYWMGHEMWHIIGDYYSKTKHRFKQHRKVWDDIKDMYKKRTRLTKKDIELIENGELWLNAQECKKKGVVHDVLKKEKRK